jgi:hypothetical protein
VRERIERKDEWKGEKERLGIKDQFWVRNLSYFGAKMKIF